MQTSADPTGPGLRDVNLIVRLQSDVGLLIAVEQDRFQIHLEDLGFFTGLTSGANDADFLGRAVLGNATDATEKINYGFRSLIGYRSLLACHFPKQVDLLTGELDHADGDIFRPDSGCPGDAFLDLGRCQTFDTDPPQRSHVDTTIDLNTPAPAQLGPMGHFDFQDVGGADAVLGDAVAPRRLACQGVDCGGAGGSTAKQGEQEQEGLEPPASPPHDFVVVSPHGPQVQRPAIHAEGLPSHGKFDVARQSDLSSAA